MANNVLAQLQAQQTGLSPQLARLVQAMASGQPQKQVNISARREPERLSQTVEADRVDRQQRDMDRRQNALQTVNPGLGRWAPLAGVVKGIASNMQRGVDDRKLEELYGQVQQQEAQQRAAAQAQAEQQRMLDIEDENRRAARDQGYALDKVREKQRLEAQNAPSGPSDEDLFKMANTLGDDLRQDLAQYQKGIDQYRSSMLIARTYANPESTPEDKAQADQVLTKQFLQTFEPGSAVMQGEFMQQAESQALYDTVVKQIDPTTGEIYGDDARRAMLRLMGGVQQERVGKVAEIAGDYAARTERRLGAGWIPDVVPASYLGEDGRVNPNWMPQDEIVSGYTARQPGSVPSPATPESAGSSEEAQRGPFMGAIDFMLDLGNGQDEKITVRRVK